MSSVPTLPDGVEGIETVTIVPKTISHANVPGVVALRRVFSQEQVSSFGLEPNDIVFNLWAAYMGGYVPLNGDWITDSSNVSYVINRIDLRAWQTRFRATCRRVVT